MEGHLPGHTSEDPRGDGEAEREGPELEHPPFPDEAQPLPVPGMDEDVKEGLYQIERYGPVALAYYV